MAAQLNAQNSAKVFINTEDDREKNLNYPNTNIFWRVTNTFIFGLPFIYLLIAGYTRILLYTLLQVQVWSSVT